MDVLHGMVMPPFGLGGADIRPPAAAARRNVWATQFLPDRLYEYYARQRALLMSSLPPNHEKWREIPAEYTDVKPLDMGDPTVATVRLFS